MCTVRSILSSTVAPSVGMKGVVCAIGTRLMIMSSRSRSVRRLLRLIGSLGAWQTAWGLGILSPLGAK